MALNQEDITQTQTMIQDALPHASAGIDPRYEMEVRERIVRVEEELKNQSDMSLGMTQQSDQLLERIDKRFDRVDKQFEEMRNDLKVGFSEICRRIDHLMYWSLGLTVTAAIFVVKMLGG